MSKVDDAKDIQSATTAPRMPRREVWLDLPESYGEAGMRIKAWVNYPERIGQKMRGAAKDPEIRAAMSEVFVEHNGWLNELGEPIPQPSDPAFFDECSQELLITLLATVNNEAMKLPNSVSATKRR